MKRGWALFVLGIVVGLFGSLFLPRLLPVGWRLALGSVEGTVEAERLEEGRLLLTLATPQGLTLASFEAGVEEIDLLVELGDRVTLAARGYRPFLDDPVIAKVVRGAELAPPVEPPPVGPPPAEPPEEEEGAPEEMPGGIVEEEAETDEAIPGVQAPLTPPGDRAASRPG